MEEIGGPSFAWGFDEPKHPNKQTNKKRIHKINSNNNNVSNRRQNRNSSGTELWLLAPLARSDAIFSRSTFPLTSLTFFFSVHGRVVTNNTSATWGQLRCVTFPCVTRKISPWLGCAKRERTTRQQIPVQGAEEWVFFFLTRTLH